MNLSKCKRMPRSSSRTNSLLWQGILVTSEIWDPIFGSANPRLYLAFFPSLVLGKLDSRKFLSSSVRMPGTKNKWDDT